MTNKLPYYLGFGFLIVSFIVGSIAFGTGYWFVAEGDDRLFQRLGLWEACFDGYEHTSDYIGKAYYGCWWIFHKEYSYIREWILPPWFIAVQTLMTFALVLQIVGLALFPGAGDTDSHKITKEITLSAITGSLTLLLGMGVLIFGTEMGEDRTWMPKPDMNEPSWSFGLACISAFFACFSAISISVFTVMRRYDLTPHDMGDLSYSSKKGQMHMVPKV